MIKSVAVFPSQCAQNAAPVVTALCQSLANAGYEIQQNSMTADAVLIWSVLWSGRMLANRSVYQMYQESGRPIIVADIGTLRRGITWKVAIGNINGAGWFNHREDLDLDRPRKLGLSLRGASQARSILIASQHGCSLQAEQIPDMTQWVIEQIQQCRLYTDRPIVVRPHPRHRLNVNLLPRDVQVQIPKKLRDTYDDFGWPGDFHAVINHNSGPGVLAAMHGSAPVVHSSSLAWPVSISMNDIDRCYDVDRSHWLIEVAHTEYTLEEISQGLWLKRLGSKLK